MALPEYSETSHIRTYLTVGGIKAWLVLNMKMITKLEN
jgi:hypothetical protein